MKTRADEYEKMLQRTWPEFFMSDEAKQRHNQRFKHGYPMPSLKEKAWDDDGLSVYLDVLGRRL